MTNCWPFVASVNPNGRSKAANMSFARLCMNDAPCWSAEWMLTRFNSAVCVLASERREQHAKHQDVARAEIGSENEQPSASRMRPPRRVGMDAHREGASDQNLESCARTIRF